jgi:hypothetical protein
VHRAPASQILLGSASRDASREMSSRFGAGMPRQFTRGARGYAGIYCSTLLNYAMAGSRKP